MNSRQISFLPRRIFVASGIAIAVFVALSGFMADSSLAGRALRMKPIPAHGSLKSHPEICITFGEESPECLEALAGLNPAAGPRGYEVHEEELGHDGNPSSSSSGGAGAGDGSSGGSSGGSSSGSSGGSTSGSSSGGSSGSSAGGTSSSGSSGEEEGNGKHPNAGPGNGSELDSNGTDRDPGNSEENNEAGD